jgi:NAD+ synthase (glutamine-hydrolysing)
MSFRSLYRHGFARVAACTTVTSLADPAANAQAILDLAQDCDRRSVALAVFPELGVSGYAISDLLQQTALLDAVESAIDTLVTASAGLMPLLLVGAPIRHAGALYNCALAIHRGRLLGVVPKIHLPNYREFYEQRHFVSGDGTEGGEVVVGGHVAPFGPDLLFESEDLRGFVVHAEICEDIWVPNPPSGEAAVAGATVLANLSASNITIGKAETRRLLCQSQSARCLAAYLYAAAGVGESTTDLAWDGQASVFENGVALAETERFPTVAQAAIADIDLDLLCQERLQMGSFDTDRRRRPTPRGWSTIATRPTTFRCPAWHSACGRSA